MVFGNFTNQNYIATQEKEKLNVKLEKFDGGGFA